LILIFMNLNFYFFIYEVIDCQINISKAEMSVFNFAIIKCRRQNKGNNIEYLVDLTAVLIQS
jgi:hypothetical protein